MMDSDSAAKQFDFIALVLRDDVIGFEEVIKLFNEMVGTLKDEQGGDDHEQEYCAAQFDAADEK